MQRLLGLFHARIAGPVVAVLLSLAFAPAAIADDWSPAMSDQASSAGLIYELKLGALYHDVPGLWSGFSVEKPTMDTNLEVDFHPIYASGGSTILPALGATLNPDGQTSHGYVDLHWRVQPGTAWFVTLGMGAAYNNGLIGPTDPDRKALGSHILFHPSAEVGLMLDAHNEVSIFFEHMSNANTQRYNEGMDDLGIRYGYKF